ncbi:hypothetical protein [Planococcus lenghuensis]|uniref:Uncharacterized protein n=1 Tax=Planococcus lenghuensis TaxID=2213202 RepID=A0A1Q2KY25_9BACL|nr:hypothetical protein [Planococcus lenghuensis]AQQ53125.1 hypothetical protein B0X71_08470 [Planococcus lenghuensis]
MKTFLSVISKICLFAAYAIIILFIYELLHAYSIVPAPGVLLSLGIPWWQALLIAVLLFAIASFILKALIAIVKWGLILLLIGWLLFLFI